ncbi:hypothetical protein AKG60_19055 [Vibrio parahaemolyticus]|uniref:Uncharacterized protein n=1 Tax=Vibrio parahaemolyticus TaxID=670 RepID=A0AAX0M7K4_VIBPH|nr:MULTISPECIES: hypothetical protein [Vibrio]EGQ8301563.1 hypothetical protein [Vibrio parahaemolyticus]EGR5855853.1 hypothetical protein [Vibrio parahaemolyticus]EJG0023648.1 hypothetical protein [Vibrio parahaemolyticus]EJG0525991.1 hypothetical protein [Vibrio parahaemolyticus]MDG3024928.1 hypothetical protein [Vibrio parahaemolyticus]
MKATIKTGHHPRAGEKFTVVEVLNCQIVVLNIDGIKTDFGISEVVFNSENTSDFQLGKFLTTLADFGVRDTDIAKSAKACAKLTSIPISRCKKAIATYHWG